MTELPLADPHLRSSHRLAAMLALLVPALYLTMRPIDDVDIFWQARLGQQILEDGFDATEPLCYRRDGEPMSWVGWLGQVGVALIHRTAGWEGVQAVHVALYVAALACVLSRIRRTGVSPGVALAAVWLTFLPCMTNCSERPQTFAFVAFALLLTADDAITSPPHYWLLAIPLLLVWQNVHPSLPVVVAVFGVRAVGALLDEKWTTLSDRYSWRRALATAAFAAAAIFRTPAGTSILAVGTTNAELSRWLGIGEWQPAYAMLPATAGFWCVLAIAVLLWLKYRVRLPWRELLPLFALTVAAVCWTRMIVFWALFSGPTLARLLQATATRMIGASNSRPFSKSTAQAARCAIAVALLGLAVGNPWIRPNLTWLPREQRALLDPQLPLHGVAALADVLPEGRIYNYREWAGVLAAFGPPGWRVAIDGRIYRQSRDEWRSYAAVALGRDEYKNVLEQDRPDALFLRPDYDRRLIQRLSTDSAWQSLYADRYCHIFLPTEKTLAERSSRPSGQRHAQR